MERTVKANSIGSIVVGAAFLLSASAGAYAAGPETSSDARPQRPLGTLYAQMNVDPNTSVIPGAPEDEGRQARNQQDEALTPTGQSMAAADVEMTRKIRRGITSDDAMSIQARNVKIITQRGVVTLRGPVKTRGEKTTIEFLAKSAGAVRIDNQLEVPGEIPPVEKE